MRFVEVFGNGSYRRIDLANVVDPPVVLTIDDEMPDAALEQNVDASVSATNHHSYRLRRKDVFRRNEW